MTFEAPFEAGTILRLRKKHPCGNDLWRVLSIGSQIELECLGCGKKNTFDPVDLRRLVRSRVSAG